jgi:hypothetical protein
MSLSSDAPAASNVPTADPFAILSGHAVIAWDLDMTLLGHQASPALHNFIRSNPQARHLIITFRAHGAQAEIWSDLAAATGTADPSCFAAVVNIDDELAGHFQRLARQRHAGLFAGPLAPAELAYLTWKGRICAEHGATVLIDDMTEHVRRGCEMHGVALLHPDTLITLARKTG